MKKVIKHRKKMKNAMYVIRGIFALALFFVTRVNPSYAEEGIMLDRVIEEIVGDGGVVKSIEEIEEEDASEENYEYIFDNENEIPENPQSTDLPDESDGDIEENDNSIDFSSENPEGGDDGESNEDVLSGAEGDVYGSQSEVSDNEDNDEEIENLSGVYVVESELTGELIDELAEIQTGVIVDSLFNTEVISGTKTYDDVTVNVEAPEGSFYSGTILEIEPIKWFSLRSLKNQLVEEKEEITNDSTVVAFNISFIYSGEEVQPLSGKTVSVTFNYKDNEDLKQAEEDESQEIKIYHINDKDEDGNNSEEREIEKIEIVENNEGEIVVEVNRFSIYTIVTQVAEEGPLAENESQLANFVYGEISIARPDNLSSSYYPKEGFTIMDRNLGALTTGAGAEASTDSYGYYYQWGNNYGFDGSKIDLDINNKTGTKVQVLSGATGYASSLFVYGYDTWMEQNRDTLRKGESGQGPCPKGWHIPSIWDWEDLYDYYNGNYPLSGNDGFINYFNLPFAGIRSNVDAKMTKTGEYSIYTTTTPFSAGGNFIKRLKIDSSSVLINNNSGWYRAGGLSVRCFKDTYSGTGDMLTISYDFNGGSGSVVNQMVKSGSFAEKPTDPIKSGYIFNGWYISGTDMLYDFTQTVVEDIELYAKYICEDGKVNNGIQCIEKHGSSTLKQGDSFNNTLLSLTGVEDIIVIKKTDVAPSDEILITGNLARSGLPVIARYENVGGTGTIYYYSEALDIYMYSNSNGMFKNLSYLTELDIRDFNTINVTTMGSMFYGCSSLLKLDLSNFNTSKVTSIADMFRGCSSLMYLDLSNFDTSKVTSMQSTFMGCSNLESLNISTFDTSSLKNISWTFDGCKNLRYLDLTSFDTTNITTMQRSFKGCDNLKIIYASEKFIATGSLTETFLNTTGVVGGNGTISSNKSGKYAHIDTEDNPGYFTDPNNFTVRFLSGDEIVTNLTGRVGEVAPTIQGDGRIYSYYSDSQKTIPYDFNETLSGYTEIYIDWVELTANIIAGQTFNNTMKTLANGDLSNIYHFKRAESITEEIKATATEIQTGDSDTEIYAWFEPNTNSGTIYYYSDAKKIQLNGLANNMFNGFKNLRTIDIRDFDTSNVTNMSSMFYNCSSLENLDLSNFNTSNVANMSRMFYNCSSLENLDLSNFNTNNVTNMGWMFRSCTNLKNINLSSFNTNNVTDMSYMFEGCSSLTELNIKHFNTNNVTNMTSMFTSCRTLTELDVTNFNTNNVTNMAGMFDGCAGLTGIDLSNFNTSNVTNMSSMFYNCSSLENLDLNNFNTSNVTNMSRMFYNCSSLENLDLSNFNTNNVTNMGWMFRNCTYLKNINLSSFNTSNVTDMSYMFYYANNLKTIYATGSFTTSAVTSDSLMFGVTNRLIGGNGTKYNSNKTNAEYAQIDTLIQSGYFTDPNNFTVRYLSGNEVVANLTGKVGETVTGLNDIGRIYMYYSDLAKSIPYDFTQTLSGYTEIYVDWEILNREVTMGVNNSEYGTLNESGDITVPHGTIISVSGNELIIGDKTIVAIPEESDNQYEYYFNGWENSCGGEENPIYFDEIIYKHDGDYKFDGTNYINTNVSLFSTENYQRDFEISFNIVNYDSSSTEQGAFINTMQEIESNGWPGFVFRRMRNNNPNLYEINLNRAPGTNKNETYPISTTKNVKILRENSEIYVGINGGQESFVYDFTGFTRFFNVPVTIGASIDGNLNPRRYVKATLSGIELKFTDKIGVSDGHQITQDCTITANFSRVKMSYPVTFENYNGTVLNTKMVEYGITPQYGGISPTKSSDVQYNYTFAGWNHEIEPVIGPQVYTATYNQSTKTYTITFNANSGNVNQSLKTVTYGLEYSDLPIPTREGYNFKGWYTKHDGTSANYIDYGRYYMYTGNLSVHISAHMDDWRTFGNSTIISSTEYGGWNIQNKDGKIEYIAYDKNNGYKFAKSSISWDSLSPGWHDFDLVFDGDYLYGYLDGSLIKQSDQFSSKEIAYHNTNSIIVGAEAYNNNPNMTEGNYFNGKIKDVIIRNSDNLITTGEAYNTIVAPNQDTTLYAEWEPTEYNINYIGIDGASFENQNPSKYTIESGEIILNNPTREHYNFIGWSGTNIVGTSNFVVIPENSTGDRIYEANWETKEYTIIWKDGNDSTLKEEQVSYGVVPSYTGAIPTKTSTAQTGYIFNNTWNPTPYAANGNETYIAQFDESVNKYMVKFIDGDGQEISSIEYYYGTTKENIHIPTNVTKTFTQMTGYIFTGWDKEIGTVTTGATYTAQFEEYTRSYLITWKNSNGEVIDSGEVLYGVIPTHTDVESGGNVEYTYVFSGWTPKIVAVTTGATYTADYTVQKNKYLIKFVNEDGIVLQSGNIEYGETPIYSGGTPTKPDTEQYTYRFLGRGESIVAVTGPKVYTAHYEATVNKYTISWNIDGNITEEEYEYGQMPTHERPEKTSDGTYDYEFLLWEPEIKMVTGNAEYTAVYKSTYIDYIIEFVDYDGTYLSGGTYHSGDFVIEPEHPQRSSTEQYSYIFTGWGEPILPVTGSKVYTAHYDEIINKYTITWIDGDGNILYSGDMIRGEIPVYSGAIPTKASTVDYEYIFNGNWMPEIKVVTGNMQYVAQFDEEPIKKEGGDGGKSSGTGKKKYNENSDTHGSADISSGAVINGEKTPISSGENKDEDYNKMPIIEKQTEFEQAYNFAKSNKITTTPSIQKAKMNTNITRIQMAKMLSYHAMNVLGQEPDLSKGLVKFNDVTDKMDKQYDNGVTLAYQLGIMGINMKNNMFRPNDEVTRAEFATALSRMLYNTDDGKGKIKYYEPHIAKLYNEGIITKTDPKMKEKRGYVMIMLLRSVK